MTPGLPQPRTYGGWRRSRGIGLLGLGPTATLALLAAAVTVLLAAAVSPHTLLYIGPPAALAAAAGLARAGGVPLAQLAAHQLRWWWATTSGHTSYRAEAVLRHTGTLQLPGTLAATELLSAEDGSGGHYGIVRDRHTGYLTTTIRVAPVSTWLAEPDGTDLWVANWGAWLASLGYLPGLRWATVTVDTAPDPGTTLADRIAASLDPAAPQTARDILSHIAATAPTAAADVDTRVSITIDPAAFPTRPATVAAAVTELGRILPGLESALSGCGLAVLGRATAAGIAGIVRTAFDPAARGDIHRLRGTPGAGQCLDWASAGPAGAEERWDSYRHDSGISVSWAWREAPRHTVHADILARLLAPGAHPKRVSLQYRPFPAATAARLLENEVRAAEFRQHYHRRTGRDLTARDTYDHARARQAAAEEAHGAGVSLLALYVTVTVTDPAQLPQAVAGVEAAAESSKIRLQRMWRSQAAGFTATLPCGICLPELARRPRH